MEFGWILDLLPEVLRLNIFFISDIIPIVFIFFDNLINSFSSSFPSDSFSLRPIFFFFFCFLMYEMYVKNAICGTVTQQKQHIIASFY